MSADARRAGAMAALLAMLKRHGDDSDETAIAAILEAAGPLSPFQSGFVEVLAEYAYTVANVGIVPDLLLWEPAAMMTDAERADKRQWVESVYAVEGGAA